MNTLSINKTYKIFGPFIGKTNENGFISSDIKDQNEFWSEIERDHPGLSTARGCYIFAAGGTKKLTPWYVGKTNSKKRGFRSEVFDSKKLIKYHDSLNRYTNYRTIRIFLIARTTIGGKFSKSIDEKELKWVEQYFIAAALRKNKNLTNKSSTAILKQLHIPGLIGNAGKGKGRNRSAKVLRSCLQ
ncbi:MAG TPA: hypothetical protein PKE19_01065 [Aestuariivirga sp.]|nr:hypothetical protein [Aestuariivirga sp.]